MCVEYNITMYDYGHGFSFLRATRVCDEMLDEKQGAY